MLIDRLLYPQLRAELADAPDAGAADSPASPSAEPSTPASTPPSAGEGGDGKGTLYEAMWGKDGLQATQEPAKEPEKVLDPSKPAEGAEAKKPAEKPKQEDAFKMPEGLSQNARDRFRFLASEVKKANEERQQLAQRAEAAERRSTEFVSIMREAGITQNDFAGFVELSRAWRSGNYDQAAQMLRRQLRELSIAAGKNFAGQADILDEFPDLAEQVATMQLPEDRALEVARARRLEGALRRNQEAQQRQAAVVGEFQQQKDQALAIVRQMVEHWRATDIDFPRKEAKIAAKMARLRDVHPSQWPARVKEIYEDFTEAAVTFGAGPAGREVRPLSGGGAPAGKAKAPQSMYEAMWGTERPA